MKRKASRFDPPHWGRPGESIEQEITRTRHGRRRVSWGTWIFYGFRHGNLVDICRYPKLMTIYRRFKCRLSLYILNDELFFWIINSSLSNIPCGSSLCAYDSTWSWLSLIISSPSTLFFAHRIHGAAIYGNMDPINIPQSCWHIYQHHGSYGYRYLWLSIRSMNHSANTSNKSTIGSVLSTTTVGHFGPGNLGQQRKRWKTPIATKWRTITIWERSLWCCEYWFHVNSDVIATPASRTRSVGSIEDNLRSNTYPTSDHICTYTI